MNSETNMDWKSLAEQHRPSFIKTLKSLLSINSVEDLSTAHEGQPFGQGVGEALAFMLTLGDSDGFITKNLEGYAGYIEYGDGEEQIGVLGHVDVVPTGDGWTTPPFSPDIRDGKIYARGAIDDKGPTLAAYFALKLVREAGLPLSKRIRLIVGTDEESGWLCMKRYGELETFPEIGFSPDADFPMIHAEKGQVNPALSILAEKPDTATEAKVWTLRSFNSGDRVNMVPDFAEAVLTCNTGQTAVDDQRGLEAAFSSFLQDSNLKGQCSSTPSDSGDTLTLHLFGRAAHGMAPDEGINAGLFLARFLAEYAPSVQDCEFLRFLSETLFNDHFGEKLGIHSSDEVSGRLTVNAGSIQYDLAAGGTVKLNIRYPATVPAEDVVQILRDRVAETPWTISELRTSKAHYVPSDHPVVQTLQRVYTKQTGEPATLLSSGGATYAKSLKYGVAFGAVFPGKEMTAHQKDEYAELDDLLRAMSIFAEAIYELAK